MPRRTKAREYASESEHAYISFRECVLQGGRLSSRMRKFVRDHSRQDIEYVEDRALYDMKRKSDMFASSQKFAYATGILTGIIAEKYGRR